MAKVNRVGSSFATLPFDGIDNVANVFMHDDFICLTEDTDVGADSPLHSELTWTVDETVVTTGPGTVAGVEGAAGHPGVVRISNAGDASDATTLMLGGQLAAEADGPILLDGNGIYIASILKIADVDAQKVEFGLVGQAPAAVNSSAADVVSFVWDPADAANVDDELFLAQVNSAGTDTEEAFSLAYVEGDWVKLEIYATDEDAYFRMTTEDGSETVHLAPSAMPLVGMRPIFTVENVGGAAEVLDIDAFHLRYARESTPANAGIEWLGA